MVSHCQFCTSSGRPSGGSAQDPLPRPYFTGLSRSHFKVAEREGFEPPIGLHLCRISSAVHSTTLPPLQEAKTGRFSPTVGASSRRGWRGRQGAEAKNSAGAGWGKGTTTMEHLTVQANGAAFHVARAGTGKPLLLLHGSPEFWLTWEPVMSLLADRHTLYAPDLRGFGDSDKPDGPYGPDQHAADMLALLDALARSRVGVRGLDARGPVTQPLARAAPERVAGLFFFDFVYPGIGPRMAEPERLNNIWYQSFNQLEMAPALVGAPRESCRTYIGYFLKAWAHRKDAFDDVVEVFTDNFPK